MSAKQTFAWTEPGLAAPGEMVQFVQVFAKDGKRLLTVRDRKGVSVTLEFSPVELSHLIGDMHEARA